MSILILLKSSLPDIHVKKTESNDDERVENENVQVQARLKTDVHRPPVLDFSKMSIDIQGPVLDESDDELEATFEFTSTGAFNIQGFEIKETGITKAPNKESIEPENVKKNLIKLSKLGRGASGIVYEMLYVPTLTLVAVKSIPCFEQEKRHQMIKELRALYANL